ncbi:PEFG-CTERM sorting domain-containing protein [Candidatus Nitrosopumilus koreensis]|uniref:PEFG-CTERM sorting domain-containing protein n=1 Tax=Candidatus Nitrosopumilus koreensis TaxID=1510466 RepID=UPI00037BBA8C|nr:PEFG-CTERM sorting domain-containing protein [Candidatus Nitrosopumilus koreensis]
MKNQKSVMFALLVISLVAYLPIAFSATLGDEWNFIKSSLSDGEKASTVSDSLSHVNDARATYENSFKDAAIELDSESNLIIETAFDEIVSNHNSGDTEMASLNKQAIDKTIYKIAYLKVAQALDAKDSKSFSSWFTVLESKFSLSEKYPDLHHMAEEISSDPNEIDEYYDSLKSGLLDIFKLKTLEEPEEAIFALDEGDVKNAQKFAYEGYYYYRTLHPAIEEKLGAEKAAELLHEMDEIKEITMSNKSSEMMKEEIEHVLDEITLIIREYEGSDSSEIGLVLSGIKDRLNLVEIEYLDAVTNGQIVNQEEYDETVAFLTKASEIFDDNQDALMELSPSDAQTLGSNLIEMEQIISSKDSTSKISILVGKSLNNIANLESFAGGAVETDIFEYFDEIEYLLNEAKVNYRNGNAQLAFDQVSTAYLDNYEFVEGPLGEVDMELMSKIEIDMREDLRNMIKNNASPDEVDAQIDIILMDLASAKKVVPEFGTIAVMILVVSIISIVAITSKSRLSLRI